MNTMFFYNSKLFGLRGVDEHRNLSVDQFELGKDQTGSYILFKGRANKTYKGGLNQRYLSAKNLKHYLQNPVLFKIYEQYLNIVRDLNGTAFYRRPLDKGSIKFSEQSVGVNKLSNNNIMKTMCAEAGIDGYFTITTLVKGHVPRHYTRQESQNKKFMNRTGHRSVESVRKYKRASNEMLKDISNILEPSESICKKIKHEDSTEIQNRTENREPSKSAAGGVGSPLGSGKSAIAYYTAFMLEHNDGFVGMPVSSPQEIRKYLLPETKQLLNDLYDECGFKYFPSTTLLLSAFCNFIGTYVKETDDGFTSIHNTLFQNLSLTAGSGIIRCLVKYGSRTFLADRLHFASLQKEHEELVILVRPEQEESYFQRFLLNIRNGYHSDVFTGVQMKHLRFRHKLIKYLRHLKPEDLKCNDDNSTHLHIVSEQGYDELVFGRKPKNAIVYGLSWWPL
ncbi:unnamed protein product [Mytilus coruscus]|uniref:ZMYM2-like/QRICH1 C-terminal domain-containing protein n=1 Tax=Mytilus coruscus TaxID=42192 RepID=A0A6J8EX36_MYTCO|nr:unnamed protein product [Mytilus coruscus]